MIRYKALGLHWREDRLLAAEVMDDIGRVKGVRPLGGTVEFGETAEAALIREFHEELGITVTPLGPPVFMENIYTYEGSPGHEIIAVFDVAFPADMFAGRVADYVQRGRWHRLLCRMGSRLTNLTCPADRCFFPAD
jgi:hypothetical protein